MKLSDSRNQLSVIEGEHAEASEALAIVQRSTSEAFDSLSPEEAGIEEEVRRLSLEVDAIGSVSDEISGIEADISRLRQELSSVERPLHEKRAKFAAAESERKSLESQLDAMAEHVARAAGANGVPEAERGQVLLAGLRVPDGLQRVVSAILGDRAGFLLSDKSSELLSKFANRSANDKAVRLGVLSAQAEFTSPARAEVSERDRQIAPSARALIDLIGIDNSSRKIAELFLNSVVVVDSAAEGAALAQARESGDERTFVTSSGEVLAPWGWWTTEGKGAQFSFGRRIEEQREAADLLKAEIDGLSGRSQEFQADIKRNESRLFERREHHRMLVRAQERLSQLMKQRAKEERRRRDEAIANERRAQGRIRELAAELARIVGAIDFEEKRTEELKKRMQVVCVVRLIVQKKSSSRPRSLSLATLI
jgi:chromosome segregation ATPase